eukprot:TRINITY_DN6791_c0_g1_i2.p2 TRINITY_DN6791_c0_g1~~TRINITY_DN6791_c0_g1_i2.p2  ORF type:complete len:129 (+),score=20.99 TRINITY_DN6791_c0_g1_i2:3-389(+)
MPLHPPFFFFSSRRRHTRFLPVSWARRCVQETESYQSNTPSPIHKTNPLYVSKQFKVYQVNQVQSSRIQYFLYNLQSVSYTHLTLPTKRIVQISVVAVSVKKKAKKSIAMTMCSDSIPNIVVPVLQGI